MITLMAYDIWTGAGGKFSGGFDISAFQGGKSRISMYLTINIFPVTCFLCFVKFTF